MIKDSARIAALERLIQKYQASYYNSEAEISDGEFDLLWDELKILAPESKVLQNIGGAPLADGFPKVKHLIPMGSQEKAGNPREFLDWAVKMEIPVDQNEVLTNNDNQLTKKLIVQYKLDGASLELQYKKGKLIRAVTRGDGITGDEITANALRMKGVHKKINDNFTGGIRGEVIMPHDVHSEKYSGKANCRNAANGIMRRKEGDGCEDLTVIVYDASVPADDTFFKDELVKMDWLAKMGFLTTETITFSSAQEIIAYRENIASNREKLPFDIDGLVVKHITIDMADLRRARPEKQIAFKFDLETAFSILRDIEWSESGTTYTPVGIVDPVHLAGTTVKRANLNNPDMIRAMGLKIGSIVSVVKRGEIIPKIEGLAPVEQPDNCSEIVFPKLCSSCGDPLVDGGTRLFCLNPACPKRLLHRLEKWVSVLDIRELGAKLLLQLFEKKRIAHIADLYTLKTAELAEYDRMGEISAAKVIRYIQAKRELSLAVFISGFDLEGIAETTMERIVQAGYDSLQKLRAASNEDIAAIYGLGSITASVIVDGLKECAGEMDAVLKTGVISIKTVKGGLLTGKSFCFTGELNSMKRGEAEDKIKALGAQAKQTVVKGLSYLVTNDPESGSGKNKKARELGVTIINEKTFLAMISGNKEIKQGLLF
jgi:DNA ligase (NAD+)